MTAWAEAHPFMAALGIYYAVAIAAIIYVGCTAADDHEEPL